MLLSVATMPDTALMIALGYLASYIPWTFVFLFTPYFGIRLYMIHDKEDCKRIQKKLNDQCTHTADGKGHGYSVGFWYLVSISIANEEYDGERYSVWLIATEESYAKLMKDKEVVLKLDSIPIETTALTVFERMGSYHACYYKLRELNIASIKPRAQQEDIIKTIQLYHAKHQHTVVYLHGPPGSGKSLVGVLLANEYGGSYCNSLKPWQPGDNFATLYSEAEPSEDKPLIIAFDEFDTAILKIHEGIPPHKHLPTQVSDKNGWNQLLDSIQRGMYPHVIVLLTSNRPPDFIDGLDSSYIRKGRVDIIAELNTQPS